jgi:PilZ domain
MKAGLPMLDRRKHVRTEVFKRARVLLGWHTVVDCTICDLSPGGAGLRIPTSIDLPSELDVIMGRTEGARSCRVIWRSELSTGVSFQ